MKKEKLLEIGMAVFNPPLYFSHKRLVRKIQNLDDKISAHIEEHAEGEPIPPNPETATPEEIRLYKQTVHRAGSVLPKK